MSNRIELIHVEVPMREPFRISSGEVASKESILVKIEAGGVAGYGEASPMSGGFYSQETPESTFEYLCDIAIPALRKEGAFDPEFVWRRPRSDDWNPFAWAGVEGALWDLCAGQTGQSVPDLLGLERRPVASGLAMGIYASIDDLIRASAVYLADGYQRLKIKIEPGWDLEPLREVRKAFPNVPLMVDANAAYSEVHFDILKAIDEMGLLMIEQPLAKGDLEAHARLQSILSTPVCLDESASDEESVLRAIRMGACRIVNLKIQRLGGIAAAKRTCLLCADQGIPCWVGTMPELGLAAIHALYLAAHPNCVFPTDVEASSRWFVEDIVDPPIAVKNGLIEIPEPHSGRPRLNMDAVNRYTRKSRVFSL